MWSVRDGGLLIDLGALRDLAYDEATEIVTAGPAVQGGNELTPFLVERGRFFAGGHCPSVGIGGFLLQGGLGWNQRGWGWSAENIVAIDVVTADGELVRADETQHSDLYWAARGSGPSFPGIVVRFHLQTRPLFGALAATVHGYLIDDFTDVMTWLLTVDADIPTNVEVAAVGLFLPDETGTPRIPGFIISGVAFGDDLDHARASLDAFTASPARERALFLVEGAPTTLQEQYAEQDRMNPEGAQYIADNSWVDGDPATIVSALRPLLTELPSPGTFTVWLGNGPRRPIPDMAYSIQGSGYVATYACYDDPAREQEHREWLAGAMAHAQPVTIGTHLADSDFTARQLRFMTDENFERLQQVIAANDPEGRFARYLAKDSSTLNRNEWELA